MALTVPECVWKLNENMVSCCHSKGIASHLLRIHQVVGTVRYRTTSERARLGSSFLAWSISDRLEGNLTLKFNDAVW